MSLSAPVYIQGNVTFNYDTTFQEDLQVLGDLKVANNVDLNSYVFYPHESIIETYNSSEYIKSSIDASFYFVLLSFYSDDGSSDTVSFKTDSSCNTTLYSQYFSPDYAEGNMIFETGGVFYLESKLCITSPFPDASGSVVVSKLSTYPSAANCGGTPTSKCEY